MFNKENIKGLGARVLIGTLAAITLSANIASAKNIVNEVNTCCKRCHPKNIEKSYIKERLKKALDALVKDGTINQKQESEITKKLYERVFIGPMQALVVDGIITEDQFGAIFKAMIEGKKSGKTRDKILQELVTAKIITSSQKEQIIKNTPIIPSRMKGIKGFDKDKAVRGR